MMFSNFSPFIFWAGLAAIAVGLYLLQRLKSKHSRIVVPTNYFWRQAVRETPVRVLMEKFRHWLAWLLILLICGLMWFVAAGAVFPKFNDHKEYILFLDGSVTSTAENEFEKNIEVLKSDLGHLPQSNREVIWSGSFHSLLLGKGESTALLDARLADYEPVVTPPSFEGWLANFIQSIPAAGNDDKQYIIQVYGGFAIEPDLLKNLPDSVSVIQRSLFSGIDLNAGITGLGISASVSGNGRYYDLLINTFSGGKDDLTVGELRFEKDGQFFKADNLQSLGQGQFILTNLPGDGSLIKVVLKEEDAFTADNVAAMHLPKHSPVSVSFVGDVPVAIRKIVEVDPSLQETTQEQAEVIVLGAGESVNGQINVLKVEAGDHQSADILLEYLKDTDSSQQLEENLKQYGFISSSAAQISTLPAYTLRSSEKRSLTIAQALLDRNAAIAQSPSLPLFLSHSLKWLASREDALAFAEAGKLLPTHLNAGSMSQSTDVRAQLLSGQVLAGQAGEEQIGNGKVHISLVDQETSERAALPASENIIPQDSEFTVTSWVNHLIVGGILILLLIEWIAYRRGRMP